jgi:hypothetical protein
VRPAATGYAPARSVHVPLTVSQFVIHDPNGQRRAQAVPDHDFAIGSAASAAVRLVGAGVDGEHLRAVRTDRGWRVEPVRPGATVRISGSDLLCKDLVAGDTIELAGHRLIWQPTKAVNAAPAAAAPVSAAPGSAAPRARRRAHSRSRSPWLLVVVVVATLVLFGWLVVRWFQGSTWPVTPQHYVDLAREQFHNHQAQRALGTLAVALREAQGSTRDEALALEAEIRRVLVELADLPKVTAAQRDRDLLTSFAARYLRDGGGRAAAREFVRNVDAWLAQHRGAAAVNADGRALVAAVEAERARYLPVAAMESADTVADVVFAARAHLRFQWRDYRSAFARLDEFGQSASGADADEVRRQRRTMLSEGEEWLLAKLRNVDQMLLGSDRDRDNAARDLDQLERWCAIPEWSGAIAERRRRLTAPR